MPQLPKKVFIPLGSWLLKMLLEISNGEVDSRMFDLVATLGKRKWTYILCSYCPKGYHLEDKFSNWRFPRVCK
jgi:hypothetical protein